MRKFVSITTGGLLLGSLLALFTVSTGLAASSSITISPTSVDKGIDPGSSYVNEVLLLNKSETDYGYTLYVNPYSVSGEDYKPEFTALPNTPDISSWFSLSQTEGFLKVNDQKAIRYTVTVPADTKPGSYYGVIFAETQEQPNNKTGIATRKRVGVIHYIRVLGTAKEEGKLVSWSVPWLQRDPLSTSIVMANSGTVHYSADIQVVVSDILGRSKYKLTRTPAVLPFKQRKVSIQWQNGAKFGLFKVSGTVKYFDKTEKLPTQYVLVADTYMRVLLVTALLVFAAAMVIVGKNHVARSKK